VVGILAYILPISFRISLIILTSVPSSPVCPSSGEDGTDYGSKSVFSGVIGRTVGDYSPSAWTTCTNQAEIIHLQTNSFHIIRHHSFSPLPSPAVLSGPPPSLSLPKMSHPVGPAVLSKTVLPLGRPGRIIDSRPVPSRALGSPRGAPQGPRTVRNTELY